MMKGSPKPLRGHTSCLIYYDDTAFGDRAGGAYMSGDDIVGLYRPSNTADAASTLANYDIQKIMETVVSGSEILRVRVSKQYYPTLKKIIIVVEDDADMPIIELVRNGETKISIKP
jgi:hypothetical protein